MLLGYTPAGECLEFAKGTFLGGYILNLGPCSAQKSQTRKSGDPVVHKSQTWYKPPHAIALCEVGICTTSLQSKFVGVPKKRTHPQYFQNTIMENAIRWLSKIIHIKQNKCPPMDGPTYI